MCVGEMCISCVLLCCPLFVVVSSIPVAEQFSGMDPCHPKVNTPFIQQKTPRPKERNTLNNHKQSRFPTIKLSKQRTKMNQAGRTMDKTRSRLAPVFVISTLFPPNNTRNHQQPSLTMTINHQKPSISCHQPSKTINNHQPLSLTMTLIHIDSTTTRRARTPRAQEEAMNALLSQQDVFLVAPTGAGKSLCFQAPAVVTKHLTLAPGRQGSSGR